MVIINNLTKKYGKFTALDNISLTINEGEVFALLGLNGAGKSTLIKILCSLTCKTSGSVSICGFDLDGKKNEIKKIINLSPQETAVANNLTVEENLDFIASLYGVENKGKEIELYIDKFFLTAKKNSKAKTLSGGQKRRLSLAMALITKPKILILDEPTLGLDIKSRKELWSVINEYKRNSTIILTTHYLEEAINLADRIAILNKGKIVANGTLNEILSETGYRDFESCFINLAGEDE